MKIGDKVRVIGLPENILAGQAPPETLAIFRKSLGGIYPIEGFNEVGWVELYFPRGKWKGDSIWLYPENVELVEGS